MIREIILILAIVVAVGIAFYAVTRLLSAQQTRRFEEAYTIKRGLLAGRLSGVVASVMPRSMVINMTIDGVKYQLRATRVYVVFRATGPVYEEPTLEQWRIWSNGSHAGVVSYLKLEDNGYTINIYYFNASSYSGASICTYNAGLATYSYYAQSSGSIESYSFRGPRQIKIYEVKVMPCRQ
jgi:preprotein translocase subunit YajC